MQEVNLGLELESLLGHFLGSVFSRFTQGTTEFFFSCHSNSRIIFKERLANYSITSFLKYAGIDQSGQKCMLNSKKFLGFPGQRLETCCCSAFLLTPLNQDFWGGHLPFWRQTHSVAALASSGHSLCCVGLCCHQDLEVQPYLIVLRFLLASMEFLHFLCELT